MTDHNLEQRLRTWYRADVHEGEAAPLQLRDDLMTLVRAAGSARPSITARWMFPTVNRFAPVALVVAAAVVILIGIGILLRPVQVGPPPVPTVIPSAELSSDCPPAAEALAAVIETRLTATPDFGMPVSGGVSLGDAYIIESRDSMRDFYPVEDGEFEHTYFVAAQIEGQGMENVGGVWVTDDPSGDGSIFAVSTRARQFSDWPDRGALEPTADGFEVADACAHTFP